MEDLALKIGLGVLTFILLRVLFTSSVKKLKQRQSFMKQYLSVLNNPEYKVKRKTS